MSLSFSSDARARLRNRRPGGPGTSTGLSIPRPVRDLRLNPIPSAAGWYDINGRRLLRLDRHLVRMPPFEEVLAMVRAKDALEGFLHRGESFVTVIVPDGTEPHRDIADELNGYSDENIHITTYNDTYLHELLVAVES